MNDEIIVAVFDTEAHADAAVRDLEAARVPPEAISRHGGAEAASGSPAYSASPRGQGFWSSLFGGEPDHDTAVYDRSLESGSSVVTVRVADEQQVERIMALLARHQPIDLEERAASYGLVANRAGTAAVGAPLSDQDTLRDGAKEEVIPLSEEQLTVGKRLVNRGTTHIRRFVVETPVEENVTLHAERVSIGTNVGPGALAGDYVGATGSATVGVGVGANVLVGGSGQSISLQPVSIEGNTGLNVAAGIGAITLQPAA